MQKSFSCGLIVILLLTLILPASLHAAVVGRFTMVRGEVELLKSGKIPGLPVKLGDGVESGDVIRTKAKAKAELSMVDDSIIVLAPESRLAVADYSYNPASGERRAVVRLLRGLVHTVVNRIIKTEEPDFIMETHTAIVGVRGTDWYTIMAPAFTSVYLVRGTLALRSNLPSLPALLLLQSMQFAQVPMGKQPLPPQPLTSEVLKMLEQLMDKGLVTGGLGFGMPTPFTPYGQLPVTPPTSPDQDLKQLYIPPPLQPPIQMPAPTPTPSPAPPGGSGTIPPLG